MSPLARKSILFGFLLVVLFLTIQNARAYLANDVLGQTDDSGAITYIKAGLVIRPLIK
jgi:hypothetical protein